MKFDLNNIRLLYWTNLYYFQMENDYGFSAIKILISNQEQTHKMLYENLKSQMDTDEALSPYSEYAGSWYQHRYEAEEMTLINLLCIQSYSMVNTYYTFFEGQLQHLCKTLSQEFGIRLKRKMPHESDLDRYYKFLENDYKIDMSNVKRSYDVICEQKNIRNAITHNQGYINQGVTISGTPGLNISQHGAIRRLDIGHKFFEYLHDNMTYFFNGIVTPLDLRFEELKKHSK